VVLKKCDIAGDGKTELYVQEPQSQSKSQNVLVFDGETQIFAGTLSCNPAEIAEDLP
jgi:hypothetical protein